MPDSTQGLGREFKEFLLRGNVVDLAVAVVVGVAFGNVVQALVRDILTPIVAAVVGKPDFGSLTFTIHKSRFFYGDFINVAISFVSIAGAVFLFVVKPVNALLARRRSGADAAAEASMSDEAALLTEIRDLLRARA
ncbi:MAG: large conductance mechanosensitive channel protein MscL [Acidimicrobiales bacterium]